MGLMSLFLRNYIICIQALVRKVQIVSFLLWSGWYNGADISLESCKLKLCTERKPILCYSLYFAKLLTGSMRSYLLSTGWTTGVRTPTVVHMFIFIMMSIRLWDAPSLISNTSGIVNVSWVMVTTIFQLKTGTICSYRNLVRVINYIYN
jgi:hypothetical protein